MMYNPPEMPNIKHEHKNNTISYNCLYIFNSTSHIQYKYTSRQADLTNQSTMLKCNLNSSQLSKLICMTKLNC